MELVLYVRDANIPLGLLATQFWKSLCSRRMEPPVCSFVVPYLQAGNRPSGSVVPHDAINDNVIDVEWFVEEGAHYLMGHNPWNQYERTLMSCLSCPPTHLDEYV